MNILLVDDHKNTCITLSTILRREGYKVATAESGTAALQLLKGATFDIVITDLKLGDMDGIDVLSEARSRSPRTEVIVITAFGSVASAVKAMKLGAYDYIAKPLQRHDILALIDQIITKRNLTKKAKRAVHLADHVTETVVGRTLKIQEVMRLVEEIARVDVPVLISGESGTGKELVAKLIHSLSARNHKPFIAINCGALPENLQETELFGHAKGAFTGAVENKKGLFEEANGGTILLDEIGEMTLAAQAKLLRVLQDGEVRPVGVNRPSYVSTRVLVATNQPLPTLVEEARFRRDLFFRINAMHIVLPPLRERMDDIPLLAEHFIKRFARRYEKHIDGLTSEALGYLQQYTWPGNVRELENCCKRAVILCKGSVIEIDDVEYLEAHDSEQLQTTSLVQQERELILKTLNKTSWNQKRTASELGIGVTTLWRKIKKYGLRNTKSSHF